MKPFFKSLLASAMLLATTLSQAVTITITDPDKKLVATTPTCKGFFDGASYKDCTSTAYLSTTSLSGNDAEFKKSFDAWNGALAADKKWTIENGGNLPGGELKVSTLRATVGNTIGGMVVQIDWAYTGGDKSKFQWSQGLKDNYILGAGGKITDPFYEMDNAGSKTSPLYPFQYGDRYFYDAPDGPMPNGSFAARTFLSQVDTDKRVLTLYEGVSYGFTLSATPVPEPSSLALALFSLALVVGGRYWPRATGWRQRSPGWAF